MAKLVDAPDLGSGAAMCKGSSPFSPILLKTVSYGLFCSCGYFAICSLLHTQSLAWLNYPTSLIDSYGQISSICPSLRLALSSRPPLENKPQNKNGHTNPYRVLSSKKNLTFSQLFIGNRINNIFVSVF